MRGVLKCTTSVRTTHKLYSTASCTGDTPVGNGVEQKEEAMRMTVWDGIEGMTDEDLSYRASQFSSVLVASVRQFERIC